MAPPFRHDPVTGPYCLVGPDMGENISPSFDFPPVHIFRIGIGHHVGMAAAAASEALYVSFLFHWQDPG